MNDFANRVTGRSDAVLCRLVVETLSGKGRHEPYKVLRRFHTVIFLDKCEKSMEGASGVLV